MYKKLSNTSVTIVLLTPQAIYHKKDYFGNIDNIENNESNSLDSKGGETDVSERINESENDTSE